MSHSVLSHLRPYAIATVLVISAHFITQWLNDLTLSGTVFLLFFAAVLGTAWFGGFLPTLYATLMAAILCNYFLIDPKGSFYVERGGDVIRLLIFMAEGAVIGLMSDFLKQSQQRILQNLSELQAHEASLREVNKELEERVARRTRDLQIANENLTGELAERQQVEAALRDSERRFHAIFDNSFQFTGLLTPAGTLLEINQTALDFGNIQRDKIIGKLLWETPELISHDIATRDKMRDALRRAAQGEFVRYELPLPNPRGDDITIDFSIKPLCDDEGLVTMLISEGRDISESKAAWNALRRSEERFQKIFHASPVAMSITTVADGRFLDVNDAFCMLYGYKREEIIGRTGMELGMWIEGTDRNPIIEALQSQGYLHSFEAQVRSKSGEIRELLSSLELVDIEGSPTILGISYDVTDRKRAEQALQASHTRMGQWVEELEQRNREINLLNEMNDLLQAARDETDAYTVVVRYIAQLFPYASGALYVLRASRNMAERVAGWGNAPSPVPFVEPDDCWGMRRGRIHVSGSGSATPLCHHARKEWRDFEDATTVCVPLIAFGETVGLLHFATGMVSNTPAAFIQTHRQLIQAVADQIGLAIANLKLREHLRFQAIRDPLTGLYNRRFMQEALTHELQRARISGASIGVVMVDVDHFKRFNDTFGHQAGDIVLKAVGSHLQEQGDELKLACRYGGEEFTLILPEMSSAQVVAWTEQLRGHIKTMSLQHGRDSLGTVTISAGVAFYPHHGHDVETLLHYADRALYTAKQEGRDRVVVYQ